MSKFLTFDFEAFEKSGGSKQEAVEYLKGFDWGLDFDELERNLKKFNEENQSDYHLYDVLKERGKDFKFREKAPQEQQKYDEAINWLSDEQKLNYSFDAQKWKEQEGNLKKPALIQGLDLKNNVDRELKKQDEAAIFEKQKEDFLNGGIEEKINSIPYIGDTKEVLDHLVLEARGALKGLSREQIEKDKDGLLRSRFFEKLERDIHQKIEQGLNFEDLDEAEKKYLRIKNYEDTSSIQKLSSPVGEKAGESAFEKMKKDYELSKKNFKDLSKEEKEYVSKERGFLNSTWNQIAGEGAKDDFKEFKRDELAKSAVTSQIQEAVNTLDLIHGSKNLLQNIFKSKEGMEELREDYLKSLGTIAELHGFNDVGVDEKGEVYFFKNDKDGKESMYHVNTGFFDNFLTAIKGSKFEIAGSVSAALAGAKLGAKYAPNIPYGKLLGTVIGGFVGAHKGAELDYRIANYSLEREEKLNELMTHSLQAGLINLVGDGVAFGVAKGIQKFGIKKPLELASKPVLWLLNHEPVTKTLRNVLGGNNFSGANKLIKESLSDEQRAFLDDLSKDFGGGMQAGDTLGWEWFENLRNKLNAKTSQGFFTSKFTNAVNWAHESLYYPKLNERRARLVDYIRADESGLNISILTQVASSSPRANLALRDLLSKSTQELERQLENLKFGQNEIREILKGFEGNTKESYNEAIEKTLLKFFEHERVQIDPDRFAHFAKEIGESGIILELKDRSFLKFLSKNLYNENGVGLEQLLNMRKSLNANFKEIKDPNLKNHFQNAIENFIRKDIDTGIENIFKKNPKLYTEAVRLFETATSDYANLKSILKNAKKLKIFDEATRKDKIVKNIVEFARGQGGMKEDKGVFQTLDKGLSGGGYSAKSSSNLETLIKGLDEADVRDIEMQVLESLCKENVKEFNNGLKIFDAPSFMDSLKSLENYNFKSQEAKDFIAYTKDFHRLFSQDARIASSIYAPRAHDTSSTLATHVAGALHVKATNTIMEVVMRNLSIPFFADKGKQNKLAFKYQVKKALENSKGLNDFKQILKTKTQKGDFSNGTRQALREFSEAVERTQNDFYENMQKLEFREYLDETVKEKGETLADENTPSVQPEGQYKEKLAKEFQGDSQGDSEGISTLAQNNLTADEIFESLEKVTPARMPEKINIDEFLHSLDEIKNKNNFLEHILNKADSEERLAYLNLIEPTFKDPDIKLAKMENGVLKEKRIKKFTDGKDFFYLLVTKEKDNLILTGFKTNKPNTIKKELEEFDSIEYGAGIIQAFTRQGSKQDNQGLGYRSDSTIKSPLSQDPAIRENQTQIPQEDKITHPKGEGGKEVEKKDEIIEAEVIEESKPLKEQNAFRQLVHKNKESLQNLKLDKLMHLYSSQRDFYDIKLLNENLKKFHESDPKEIPMKKIKEGYILDDLLGVDEDCTFAVVRKSDLKPSLTRSNTQFRAKQSNSMISDIKNSFNEREHFKESSNFDGVPTITKEGLVIAGNHRTTAIKELSGENLERYIRQAKKTYGENVFKDLNYPENEAMVVRILHKNDDETIIRLSKLSNDGRLSSESEKLEALGAKYKAKLENIEDAKGLNTDKELMNYLGSKDGLESQRALLDYLIPDIQNALLAWEKRSGGDLEFSRILNENALPLLHLKQAIRQNGILDEDTKDFFKLFKGAIENINNTSQYKSVNELYESIKKYSTPSLNFEKEFIRSHRDLQSDILGFILKYNDTLSNPGEAFEEKLRNAIKFLNNNDVPSMFEEARIGNYDILNQMLQKNITQSTKYQEALNAAIANINKETDEARKALNQAELKELENSKNQVEEPFGINYKKFYRKGKEAIKHLLEQKQGQVQGAFYREDLGDIDLVWGEAKGSKEDYGLAHIIDKHKGDFKDLADKLSEIVENGELAKDKQNRLTIVKDNFRVGLKSNWKGEPTQNKWIITAYYAREADKSILSNDFTKGERLPLNSPAHSNTSILNIDELDWSESDKRFAKESLEKLESLGITQRDLEQMLLKANKELMDEEKEAWIYPQEVVRRLIRNEYGKKSDEMRDEMVQNAKKFFLDLGFSEKNLPTIFHKLLWNYRRSQDLKHLLVLDFDEYKKRLKKGTAPKKYLNLFSKALENTERIHDSLTNDAFDEIGRKIFFLEDLEKGAISGHWVYKFVNELVKTKNISSEEVEKKVGMDFNTAKITELKSEFLKRLKPLFNQELKSKTGESAYFNLKSLSKMMSDGAIGKSLNNGFSRDQYLRAVLDIKTLFERASLIQKEPHRSGEKRVLINRFNSEFENANALITTKESLDKNLNRIYSVELELVPRF